jgi:hypothetical protein
MLQEVEDVEVDGHGTALRVLQKRERLAPRLVDRDKLVIEHERLGAQGKPVTMPG